MDELQLDKMIIETYPDQTFQSPDDEWQVLFNPSDYALSRSNSYNASQAAGTSRPATAFGHGNPDQLSVTFLLDGTGVLGDPGPVTARVRKFLDLMRYEGDEHKPRYLRVRWGALDFRCYLKTATATFTLFNREGEAIRAKISGSFEEVVDEQERVNREAAASADLFRLWEVSEGETLDGIAHQVYGDVRFWRALAAHNRLETARALAPGLLLELPPEAR